MKKTRRFGIDDIARRRKEYIRYRLSKGEIYCFEELALNEYKTCQRQRKNNNLVEIARFSHTIRREKGNRLILPRIAVSVTNQCSLKCRDCNNLMPYCKERFFVDVEEQIYDLKKILYYADGIVNVEIIGGEPFIYKQLPILLKYLCEEPKIHFVEVTSNGTIMPSEEVLALLKAPKVCVLLSDYGKVNREKVVRTYQYLRNNGVCVSCLKNRKWIYPGGIYNRRKTKIQMKYEYFHCFARRNCRTLYKGKLYVCGRAPILDELRLLNGKSSLLDIRSLKEDNVAGKEILQQFFNNTFADCCNYCDCSSDQSYWIESGIQIKKQVRNG